jgi:hypothetical protein
MSATYQRLGYFDIKGKSFTWYRPIIFIINTSIYTEDCTISRYALKGLCFNTRHTYIMFISSKNLAEICG